MGKSAFVVVLCLFACWVWTGHSKVIMSQRMQRAASEAYQNNRTDLALVSEARKRKGSSTTQEPGMMSKILPMMVMPFMVSTGMIPMMLMSLKFMMLQSAFIGKIAIILMLINMFRPRNSGGGVFSHNIHSNSRESKDDVAMKHYGYTGGTEYGAYVN